MSSRHYKILLVEDHKDTVELMALALRVLGHEVECAFDGAQALEMLASFAPEVIVTDLGLPEVDGFELARRVRAIPAHADVPIVAVTGYGTDDDMSRAKAAGITRHLLKPVGPGQLLATIATVATPRGAAA